MKITELNEIFFQCLETNEEYHQALDILLGNNIGQVWLIGGSVYRRLASLLYGVPQPGVDLDFIVDHAPEVPMLPVGWRIEKNNFGNYKYISKGGTLDVVPLTNIHSIMVNKLEPTIENYLKGTPLTIQSIAYNVMEKELIGEVGINAVLTQTVGVNSQPAAEYVAQKYRTSIEDYAQEKATSLNFVVTLL